MKKLCAIISLLLLAITALPAFSADILGAEAKMKTAEYWISRIQNPDAVVMTPEEIQEFNGKILATPNTYCKNLLEYPETLPKERVLNAIGVERKLLPDNYVNGRPVTQAFLNGVTEECNLDAVCDEMPVRYAFAAKNSMIKTVPTTKSSHKSPDDKLFDRYIESFVKIWEPLAVFHTSRSGKWCYVVSQNSDGWVRAEDLTFVDKETMQKYLNMPFIIVTGAKIYPCSGLTGERYEFQLGTRFPLAEDRNTELNNIGSLSSYSVLLPGRDADGNFCEKKLLIPYSADVHEGFIPYTQKNLLKHLFKFLGEQYGWGGSFGQWDCSAMIHDVYSIFGFALPRNSGAQARIQGLSTDTRQMSDEQKCQLLATLPAGAILQMNGHVMLYLGTVNNKPYIFHETYSAFGHSGALKKIIINCAVVSDMDIRRSDGQKIISCIKRSVAIQ
ncbi:MAG: SH3 domain-containing protein [Synergistaceae bacterium]|nr:SH3 domain-containing protein [Synergistaceae bacterium]